MSMIYINGEKITSDKILYVSGAKINGLSQNGNVFYSSSGIISERILIDFTNPDKYILYGGILNETTHSVEAFNPRIFIDFTNPSNYILLAGTLNEDLNRIEVSN